jgi:hypothetical protein
VLVHHRIVDGSAIVIGNSGSYSSAALSVRVADGHLDWRVGLPPVLIGSGVLTGGQTVAATSGEILALEGDSGRQAWRWQPTPGCQIGAFAASDATVVASMDCRSGTVVEARAADGRRTLWRHAVRDSDVQVQISDGVVALSTGSWLRLLRLDGTTLLARSGYLCPDDCLEVIGDDVVISYTEPGGAAVLESAARTNGDPRWTVRDTATRVLVMAGNNPVGLLSTNPMSQASPEINWRSALSLVDDATGRPIVTTSLDASLPQWMMASGHLYLSGPGRKFVGGHSVRQAVGSLR